MSTITKNIFTMCIIVLMGILVSKLYSQEHNTEESVPKTGGTDNAASAYIQTATEFMQSLADTYGKIKDMQALLTITRGSVVERSTIFVKVPNKMRIVFSQPRNQVINSDGEDFYIYLPQQNVVLHQKREGTSISSGTFVTRTGLDLLSKNYIASYLGKPEYKPMISESDSEDQLRVIKIRLRWHSPKQSFREIILFVGEDSLIHRVSAITFNRDTVRFDFSNIVINEGIPDARFKYDSPATAHVLDNLFYEGN